MTYIKSTSYTKPIVRVTYNKVRYDIYSEDRDNWYTDKLVIPKNKAKVIHIYEDRTNSRVRWPHLSGD